MRRPVLSGSLLERHVSGCGSDAGEPVEEAALGPPPRGHERAEASPAGHPLAALGQLPAEAVGVHAKRTPADAVVGGSPAARRALGRALVLLGIPHGGAGGANFDICMAGLLS